MLLGWILALAFAQDGATAGVEVGPISFFSVKDAPDVDVTVDQCVSMAPPPPVAARSSPPDGQLVFELVFKRGSVKAVTVARTEPSLDWLTPCLTRELAAVKWEIKKGRAEVPITVKLPSAPVVEEPEPEPEPEAETADQTESPEETPE